MILSDLHLVHGTRFSLTSRVRYPVRRKAANGSNYLTFTLEDYFTSLKAYAWPEQCDLSVPVHDLDAMAVEGKIREFNGDMLAAVTAIRPVSGEATGAIDLIPRSACPEPLLLVRLREIVSQLSNDSLRWFIGCVFADDSFALPFVRLPASRRHHHSKAGGLLAHSLECAEMVQRFSEFEPDMRDLAVTGALLHDAGKVVTLRRSGFSPVGMVLDHDALTLEVLAPHLKWLDTVNRDLGTALRYLWTWRHHRRGQTHPVLTIAEAVCAADRISSGLSIEEIFFSERPEWQTIGRAEGRGGLVWRPQFGCQAPLVGNRAAS